MNTAERKALEYLSGCPHEYIGFMDIPNGLGRAHVTEKTLIAIEGAALAGWNIYRGWFITEAGRAALAAKEEQP